MTAHPAHLWVRSNCPEERPHHLPGKTPTLPGAAPSAPSGTHLLLGEADGDGDLE